VTVQSSGFLNKVKGIIPLRGWAEPTTPAAKRSRKAVQPHNKQPQVAQTTAKRYSPKGENEKRPYQVRDKIKRGYHVRVEK
jgi:hypothetical protein